MSLKLEGISDSKYYEREKEKGISHGSLNDPSIERVCVCE